MTGFYQFFRFKRGKSFAWFPEEVPDARRQAEKHPDKCIVGDTAKINSQLLMLLWFENVNSRGNEFGTSTLGFFENRKPFRTKK